MNLLELLLVIITFIALNVVSPAAVGLAVFDFIISIIKGRYILRTSIVAIVALTIGNLAFMYSQNYYDMYLAGTFWGVIMFCTSIVLSVGYYHKNKINQISQGHPSP